MSRRQLYAVGVQRGAIERRLAGGQLHSVHRGVYAVGHMGLSQEGRWMAAVLACGGGAVLSHRSAAELWGLLRPEAGPVDISIPTDSGRRRRSGIRLHRCLSLASAASARSYSGPLVASGRSCNETTERRSIPVTRPGRTIADLRAVVTAAEWRRAIRQAEVRGLTIGPEIATVPTRSELEDRFLVLCRRHRLPAPAVNERVGRHEVDFLWPTQRVIAETDGYRYHRGAQAFEDDHERDLDLEAQGYAVRRFTYRQVTAQPARVATALRAALG